MTSNVSSKRCWRALFVAGLAVVLLSFAAFSGSNVRAAEPGVNCASYSGPGGVCVIEIGDIWFCDESFSAGVCETTISVGDTVSWDFGGTLLPHTTTACGADCNNSTATPLWDSGLVEDGSTFEFTFDTPGTYLYFCTVHPTLQRGRIIVQQDLPPMSTPSPLASTGDANCSGGIDSIDAALVLQLVAGLVGSLPCEENADTNGEDGVTLVDATMILQHIAGLLPTLPT